MSASKFVKFDKFKTHKTQALYGVYFLSLQIRLLLPQFIHLLLNLLIFHLLLLLISLFSASCKEWALPAAGGIE